MMSAEGPRSASRDATQPTGRGPSHEDVIALLEDIAAANEVTAVNLRECIKIVAGEAPTREDGESSSSLSPPPLPESEGEYRQELRAMARAQGVDPDTASRLHPCPHRGCAFQTSHAEHVLATHLTQRHSANPGDIGGCNDRECGCLGPAR